ncbi:hypothetical protein GALMADRAFT_409370 [Galerina marginata CBS 339.88]|uniref:Uncharacterized protein n=1 Tax=Galerina marginata (strain CBS 339.88) TaxID=685588 RepID=A0A067T363_GALM3|nr:hypothetical protein GALMADRAFT_409370 [Galerina marginata CBS 339.88]
MQLYQSRTLDGALYRLSLEQEADPITLTDFFSLYSQAAPEEIHGLGDYLIENISQLRAFYNFYSLLNMPKRSEHLKNDPRLIAFKKNSERAQKILDAAAIERHIKNIDSLGQEKTLQKVWKEFDSLSQKKEKKSIETLIGYEKLPPRWWIPPRIIRTRPTPSPNVPSRDLPIRPRNETIPVSPPVEHEPSLLSVRSRKSRRPVSPTLRHPWILELRTPGRMIPMTRLRRVCSMFPSMSRNGSTRYLKCCLTLRLKGTLNRGISYRRCVPLVGSTQARQRDHAPV